MLRFAFEMTLLKQYGNEIFSQPVEFTSPSDNSEVKINWIGA